MPQVVRRLDHLTFKGNLRDTRYGWLRLTPAYSVHLVTELLDEHWRPGQVVLDPFCGTGTTALVCAERGIECDTTDINPFLLWLTTTKAAGYSAVDLEVFRRTAAGVGKAIVRANGAVPWLPSLHQIEKWWSASKLAALGRAMGVIRSVPDEAGRAGNLLKIAFCRTMITHANVSFGHQSMSFKKRRDAGTCSDSTEQALLSTWQESVTMIAEAARVRVLKRPRPISCDARDLTQKLARARYGLVITSPPYPNRMSYIRELRPYMYWLGYLADGRQAGELDWQAIGGTWGCATSNVAKWEASERLDVPYTAFRSIVERIAVRSSVLSRYVDKYFHDMMRHCKSLDAVVEPGGSVHYIVGNSKFYDVLLPVEEIYAAMLEAVGFVDVKIDTIRKRTSKRELFEFVVGGRKRRSRRSKG